jgi:hypothetical protein
VLLLRQPHAAESRTLGLLALALFIAVQIGDACSTAAGVAQFGHSIEANPFLASLMAAWGTTGALVAGKTMAIAGGVVLHIYSRHVTLALLTVGYVFAAIVPWAFVLTQ